MVKDNDYIKKTEEYIDYIINSKLEGKELLKREYPGVIEHDEENLIIAQEIYRDLKEMCIKYQNREINVDTFSKFCGDIMYSKYSPKIVNKIVADEIFDALDYISELNCYK